jgi:hypothetical protein
MIAVLAALLVAAAPAAAEAAPGLYLANQMEVGAGLELLPGGRFRYALDYGAVSEGAEGQWRSDGITVYLTNDATIADPERSVAAFRAQPLRREGDLLLLERYETVIRLRRVPAEAK